MFRIDFVKLIVLTTFTACSAIKFTDQTYIEFCLNRPGYKKLRMASGIVCAECEDSVESL